jgi:ferredoxin
MTGRCRGVGKAIVRVFIDMVRCSGCGACSEVCPEAFGYDAEVQLPFLKQDFQYASCLLQAVAYCPEDCIEVEEG